MSTAIEGPCNTKKIREPTGGDAEGIAERRISIDPFLVAIDHPPVIAVADADKDAGSGCRVKRAGADCRIFQRLPRSLHQQPVLWVHADRLTRRDSEEFRVELVYPSDKRTVAGVHLTRFIGIKIVIGVEVPAIARDFGNGVYAIRQHLPERGFVMRSARQAQPDADNGNGFLLAAVRFVQLRAHFAQLQDGALQRRELFLCFPALTHDFVISSIDPVPPEAVIRLRFRTFLEALRRSLLSDATLSSDEVRSANSRFKTFFAR